MSSPPPSAEPRRIPTRSELIAFLGSLSEETKRRELDPLLWDLPPSIEALPFPAWLRLVSPTWQWEWPHLVHIQERLAEVTGGTLKRLLLTLPPRHGKSEQTTIRYPVWRLETAPETRVCVGSYNQRFAERFGRRSRRLAEARGIVSRDRSAAMEWETPAGGVYRSCGVGSPPTGEGFDLILIDDPVKSREEAESEAYRERVWEWYGDLYTRLEPGGAIILILTRWHEDDVAGRLLAEMAAGGEAWTTVNLPGLAEEGDPLQRTPGEALCRDRYDEEALQRIKGVLGSYAFSALYQGSPRPREGNLFKWAWMMPPVAARPSEVEARIRYYDTAGTEGRGDYTAGVLMSRTRGGTYWIEDVVRGQWSPAHRDAEIRATAERDGPEVQIWLERESGVAGTERSQATVRALAGFVARFEPVTGDKVHRADPLAAQAEAGNVRVVAGPWNHALLDELTAFPNGSHDDQVDAAAGAFSKLAASEPWEFW